MSAHFLNNSSKHHSACVHTRSSLYNSRLMQGRFAIAFLAALRISKLTCNTKQLRQNLIFLNQVAFVKMREGSITSIKLTLRHHKHSTATEPVDNFIHRAQPVCPVYLLLAYLNLKGSSRGPLFCWGDFFTKALADPLLFCDLDVSGYKSHTFRIGAVSRAASQGMSDAQIRAFRRWKSNAFLQYNRAPSIGSKS